MSCEDIDMDKLTKKEAEEHYRLHLFEYLNGDANQNKRAEQSMDRLERSYRSRFGATALVVFKGMTMRGYEKAFKDYE